MALSRLVPVLAVVAAAAALASGVGARGELSYRPALERLDATHLAVDVENSGADAIGLVAVRGDGFDVQTVVSARTSAGAPPQCTVVGTPPTLHCAGFTLAKGARLAVVVTTSAPPNSAELAVTDGSEPASTAFFPEQVTAPLPRGTLAIRTLSRKRLQLAFLNTGHVPITKVFVHGPKGASVASCHVAGRPCRFHEQKRSLAAAHPETPGELWVLDTRVDEGDALKAILVGGILSPADVGFSAVTASGQPAVLSRGP